MELPDGAQVQFVAHAVRGVQGAWPELILALDQVVFISVYEPGSFLVLYFYSKTQPQQRKVGLEIMLSCACQDQVWKQKEVWFL